MEFGNGTKYKTTAGKSSITVIQLHLTSHAELLEFIKRHL